MPQRPLLALALRLCSALLLATLLMLVKLAGEAGIALPEIMFWRQAVSVVAITGWLWATGGLGRLRTQRLAIHGRRAAIGMTNMIFNFGAAILLPLSIAAVLGFTAPMFAVVIAALVMRERIGPWRWTAVVLGFIGVVVVAQPWGGGEPIPLLGAAAALTAALLIAVINFQIRDLARSEDPVAITFWFAAFGTPIAACALPFFASAHSAWQWTLLIALGLAGTGGQVLLAASLRHGAVASVIVMDYTTIVWATLYGWAVWDHLPTAATLAGAPLVIAAGAVIAWREHRLSKKPTSVLEAE
jgi:drug/metabolite transporter (DMT)-like permease